MVMYGFLTTACAPNPYFEKGLYGKAVLKLLGLSILRSPNPLLPGQPEKVSLLILIVKGYRGNIVDMLTHPRKSWRSSVLTVLLVLMLVSCQPAADTPSPTPVIQTVEVTQEVTRQVTQEVTRLLEVPIPVTVTPSLTPAITITPSLTPTITPTADPPVVTILAHVACNFGPGDAYLYDYGLLETSWMEVIGRNQDGTWLFVEGVHGWNPCWVKTESVRFNDGGDVTNHDIRIFSPDAILPFATNLYRPPTGVQAFRYGNEVKIFWNAVWMTEDDYRGYLIEAWLCQGGQQVFKPINKQPPLNENVNTLVLSVIDEPGCLVPSSARIYTAEKHGYTGYIVIPWPPYQSSPNPTPTP
jgi:hypothetical protein